MRTVVIIEKDKITLVYADDSKAELAVILNGQLTFCTPDVDAETTQTVFALREQVKPS